MPKTFKKGSQHHIKNNITRLEKEENKRKTLKKGILKQGSQHYITNQNIINQLKKEENELNNKIINILKGKSNAFKKSFKNQYNKYNKHGNRNIYMRNKIRKLTGRNSGKSVKFQTILGTRI
jgi:hypothetical protein